jgi:hypothetical protein
MKTSDTVMLKGGITVPVTAFRLALDLEDRGLAMKADGDVLIIGPRDRITDALRAAIRANKPALLTIAKYEPPAIVWTDVKPEPQAVPA